MKIRFFKLVAVFVSLSLLLTAESVQKTWQVSSPSIVKTSAISIPSSPSFASVTTRGDQGSDPSDQPGVTSRTQRSVPISITSRSGGERAMTLVQSDPDPQLAEDLVQPAQHTKQKLRHSISGRVVDINKKPIPGVTLSISGVYDATTDATGRYRVTNLVTTTYTITPSKPTYTFSPTSRTIDLQTDVIEQDFTVEPDLGFRPWRDGYSFNNPGQAVPDCQAFQRSFSGLDIQCSYNQPQQRYLALFDRYKFSFGSGVCTGMAATSLAYYVRLKTPPYPSSTYRLTRDESWPDIATFHGRQYSKAVLDRRLLELSRWTTTQAISQKVDDVYRQLRSAVQPGNRDPVVLDLVSRPSCEASGHTVTPYRLDETDPSHPKVYVYENYSAGDTNKFIQFDFSLSEHRFSYSKWDSALCGALVAIPISAFVGPGDNVPSAHLPEQSALNP